ncbi:MFS transporter [candidate division WOR-3 bacterium]|nr:MFS transporter [candidate division WOR-3 bacterium]
MSGTPDTRTPEPPSRRALSESVINRGLRVSIVEGAFAMLYATLAGGMFLTGLALYSGANSLQLAFITAIPPLATGFGFLSGYLVRRAGSRKRLVLWTAGLGRAAFFVLVPFLLLRGHAGLPLLFAVMLGSSILMNIAGTTWTSWMSDLVPEQRRGRFFGLRNAIHSAVGVAVAYLAGRGMDWLKAQGHEPLGYGLAFGLAALFGTVSTVLLVRQPEPELPARPQLNFRATLVGPLHEPQFRRLMTFLGAWFLTGTLASPFYLPHLMKNLHFSFAAIGVYSVVGGGLGVLFQLFWGRVIDRFGSRPVTVVTFAMTGLMPLMWVFATPSFRLPIWLDAVMNGVVWTGGSLGLWNLLLDLADHPEHKESYFAIYGVVTGLGAFVASLLSGTIAHALDLAGFRVVVAGREFVSYHVLFCAAGVFRFVMLPLLLRVQERDSKPVRHTMRVLATTAVWRLNASKEWLLRALLPRDR